MSDPLQRQAEAEHARLAWEQFVAPALAVVRADYLGKLTDYAERPMTGDNLKVVEKMAVALKVTKVVEEQLRALIADGDAARADMDRAGTLARMSDEQRRYATY